MNEQGDIVLNKLSVICIHYTLNSQIAEVQLSERFSQKDLYAKKDKMLKDPTTKKTS